MLILLAPTGAMAESVWREGAGDFQSGALSQARLVDGNVTLGLDDSAPREWTLLSNGTPSERSGAAIVYDPVNGETLLFGGSSPGGYHNDTWAFNSTTRAWMRRTTCNAPSPRYGSAMTFDGHNNEVLLYGGRDDYLLHDTWVLNVTSGRWTDLGRTLSVDNPNCLIYDTANSVAVMFGSRSDRIYVYNTTTRDWSVPSSSPGPYPKSQFGIAYDEANGVVVLFGGRVVSASDQTWTYDVGKNAWTQLLPSVSPSPRYDVWMTYDRATGASLVIGGQPTDANDEVWSFNQSRNAWTNLTTADVPVQYGITSLAHEDALGGTVVHCTSGPVGAGYSMWAFDAASKDWTLLNQSDAPCARQNHAMTFDAANDVGVLFGGEGGGRNDMWLYNPVARAWERRLPSPAPYSRTNNLLTYDTDRERVLLFGGDERNETWVYDTRNDTWERMNPPVTPPAWTGSTLAYDEVNKVHVLFTVLSETWTYDLSRDLWTRMRPPAAPPQRTGMAMAYDSTAGAVVLFGGANRTNSNLLYNDVWTYDPASDTWNTFNPPVRPRARQDALLLDHPHGDGVLLAFGTADRYNWEQLNDTWVLDTARGTWTILSTLNAPRRRTNTAGFYCELDETVYILGGYNRTYDPSGASFKSYMLDDLWSLGPRGFAGSGVYTSAPKDTGGRAYFGTVSAVTHASDNTSVRIQLRGAGTLAGLLAAAFVGPDGTESTHHDGTGERVHGSLNGSRWIQYRAALSTTNPLETPRLEEVQVRYNLMHDVAVTSPRAGSTVSASQNISWDASDLDGDALAFDIYLLNGTDSTALATDLPDDARDWHWDMSAVPTGTYAIRVVARDVKSDIPLVANASSGPFTVKNWDLDNRPPTVELLGPEDEATVGTADVDLSWSGQDEDDDAITYYVHVSAGPLASPSVDTLVTITTSDWSTLEGLTDGTTYYWTVVPNDGRVNGSFPPAHRFTVALPPPNRPPEAGLVAPPDAGVVASADVVLEWTASDPDGDDIGFHVLVSREPFGPQDRPPAWAVTSDTSLTLSGLLNGTTIYWTVVPFDVHANGTAPAVRWFRVDLSHGNHPPRITSAPPTNATVGVELVYDITAVDEDGDELTFALVSPPAGASVDAAGRLSWVPDASQEGVQTLAVRAVDPWGAHDTQTFQVTVGRAPAPPVRPSCTILVPSNGSVVRGVTSITGTASRGSGPGLVVSLSIDGGEWTDTTGGTAWQFVLDTRKLTNGVHTISARAHDILQQSEVATVTVTVDNPTDTEEPMGGWLWVLLVIVLVALAATGIAVRALRRARSRRPPVGDKTPPLSGVDDTGTVREAEGGPERPG